MSIATDALAVIDYAETNGYTPAQVLGASFTQLCTILGYDKDDPPFDFEYRTVRQNAAAELWKRKNDADDAALAAKIKQKVVELVEMAGAEITKTEDGWLITKG